MMRLLCIWCPFSVFGYDVTVITNCRLELCSVDAKVAVIGDTAVVVDRCCDRVAFMSDVFALFAHSLSRSAPTTAVTNLPATRTTRHSTAENAGARTKASTSEGTVPPRATTSAPEMIRLCAAGSTHFPCTIWRKGSFRALLRTITTWGASPTTGTTVSWERNRLPAK